MFTYLRYFSAISFVLVLLAAFIVGIYFRSIVANQIIKESIEQTNVIFAQSYINNIWTEHNYIFKQLQNIPINQWNSNSLFTHFYEESTRYFKNTSSIWFNIYSTNNEQFFTSNPSDIIILDEIENSKPGDSQFQRSVRGNIISNIVNASHITSDQDALKQNFVQTYVPIKTLHGNTEHVTAVIEVLYDISPFWKYISYFQVSTTVGIVLIFSVLYGTLFFTSGRAEKVINKQHETNMRLAKAKAEAEKESQEKSQFLANVSHELRTPLNAIIGFSEIIKDEVVGPMHNKQYTDYITDIHSSGVHLLSLINDILDYSKAEAQKLDVDTAQMDLTKAAKTSLRLVETRAEEAKVTLEANIPKEHIILVADNKRIKQVLLNLLSNAVKFTPEGGTVTLLVEIDQSNGSLIIEVQDTGIGIAAKDISRAMSTFGQVDSTLSRRFEGTGLGLPLTKRLVELMGGTFNLKSEEGLGTTVTLTFPKDKVNLVT